MLRVWSAKRAAPPLMVEGSSCAHKQRAATVRERYSALQTTPLRSRLVNRHAPVQCTKMHQNAPLWRIVSTSNQLSEIVRKCPIRRERLSNISLMMRALPVRIGKLVFRGRIRGSTGAVMVGGAGRFVVGMRGRGDFFGHVG